MPRRVDGRHHATLWQWHSVLAVAVPIGTLASAVLYVLAATYRGSYFRGLGLDPLTHSMPPHEMLLYFVLGARDIFNSFMERNDPLSGLKAAALLVIPTLATLIYHALPAVVRRLRRAAAGVRRRYRLRVSPTARMVLEDVCLFTAGTVVAFQTVLLVLWIGASAAMVFEMAGSARAAEEMQIVADP